MFVFLLRFLLAFNVLLVVANVVMLGVGVGWWLNVACVGASLLAIAGLRVVGRAV